MTYLSDIASTLLQYVNIDVYCGQSYRRTNKCTEC